jgi:hypothetical protein
VFASHKKPFMLKEPNQAWHSQINSFSQKQGIVRSEFNQNLYYLIEGKKYVMIIVYVDDLLVTCDCSAIRQCINF